jgi:hypothetical protein
LPFSARSARPIWLSEFRDRAPRARKAPREKAPSAFQHRLTRFWDARPFSRLIAWGKDYLRLKDYLELNTLETKGFAKAHGRILLSHLEEYRRRGKLDIGA